jgi:thiol:disulfide interchange protein
MSCLQGVSFSKDDSSFTGTLLMGLMFSLTSFTCIAPFIGTLLVIASQGNWRWPLVGMAGFSFVFAIPFFLLALAPQLMARMPKAGAWMNSIKIVMGFLEIAAAMKFLSNADLIWHWNIFTRSTVLCIWASCMLLIVAYLLGWVHLDHDGDRTHVSGTGVLFSLAFLAGSIWLLDGLAGKSLGDLEAFLPPMQVTAATDSSSVAVIDAPWILDNRDSHGGYREDRSRGACG